MEREGMGGGLPFFPTSGEGNKDSAAHRYQQAAAAKTGRTFLPAAGWRNGGSLNNQSSNGNYWSSTVNPSNSNNARNLNFNSGDVNTNNNLCARSSGQ